jgi:hypothetical protein
LILAGEKHQMKNFFFVTTLLKKFTNTSHIPELTEFLKNNQGFKSLSWKIFHMKDNILKNLDDTILTE